MTPFIKYTRAWVGVCLGLDSRWVYGAPLLGEHRPFGWGWRSVRLSGSTCSKGAPLRLPKPLSDHFSCVCARVPLAFTPSERSDSDILAREYLWTDQRPRA